VTGCLFHQTSVLAASHSPFHTVLGASRRDDDFASTNCVVRTAIRDRTGAGSVSTDLGVTGCLFRQTSVPAASHSPFHTALSASQRDDGFASMNCVVRTGIRDRTRVGSDSPLFRVTARHGREEVRQGSLNRRGRPAALDTDGKVPGGQSVEHDVQERARTQKRPPVGTTGQDGPTS
jgi:hypothetical protein